MKIWQFIERLRKIKEEENPQPQMSPEQAEKFFRLILNFPEKGGIK